MSPATHSLAAEERVLSFLNLDGAAALQICAEHGITAESFYSPVNREIFTAACSLNARGVLMADGVCLGEECCTRPRERPVRWDEFVPATRQIPAYGVAPIELPPLCRELRRLQSLRATHRKNMELAEAIQSGDADKTSAAILALQECGHDAKPRATWSQTGQVEIERAEAVMAGREDPDVRSLPWPWRAIDIDFKPFRRGESVVVAGYTSNGKSSLLRQLCVHHARKGYNVALVSLEMPPADIFNLMASAHSGQPWSRLKGLHPRDQSEFLTGAREVRSLPIEVFEQAGLGEISAWVRGQHQRRWLDCIAIDYLGLVRECTPQKGQTKASAVGEVAAAFKRMAVELQCVVFLAVQINRGPTNDGNREPRLSDLKDSGDIEAHADRVVLLYRPDRDKANNRDQSTHDTLADQPRFYMEIFQEKGRNVGTGSAALWLRRELARFELIA